MRFPSFSMRPRKKGSLGAKPPGRRPEGFPPMPAARLALFYSGSQKVILIFILWLFAPRLGGVDRFAGTLPGVALGRPLRAFRLPPPLGGGFVCGRRWRLPVARDGPICACAAFAVGAAFGLGRCVRRLASSFSNLLTVPRGILRGIVSGFRGFPRSGSKGEALGFWW